MLRILIVVLIMHNLTYTGMRSTLIVSSICCHCSPATTIGPTPALDRLYLTCGYREQRRTYYSKRFRTFGLEWNDKFMWTCSSTFHVFYDLH